MFAGTPFLEVIFMNNALEVGQQLVSLCQEGKFKEAIDELYSPDIVSVEAMPGEMQTVQGLDAIFGKLDWWESSMEVHSVKVDGPFPHGDEFIVFFDMDVTDKEKGVRFPMREAALYTVKDGKIVHEKFYYTMG
jgi:ketosteroid isomerase-like protein